MSDLFNRVIFSDSDDETKAVEVLDEAGEDFDWDSGDRMMISDSGINALDNNEIDYNII